MIRCGRHPSPAIGAAGEPAPGLHAHEPIQLVILVVVQLRLVQLADVHRNRTDVPIIQRTTGCADVGTMTREGIARGVDGQIISGEIVQLKAIGVTGRDGAAAVLEKHRSSNYQCPKAILKR